MLPSSGHQGPGKMGKHRLGQRWAGEAKVKMGDGIPGKGASVKAQVTIPSRGPSGSSIFGAAEKKCGVCRARWETTQERL